VFYAIAGVLVAINPISGALTLAMIIAILFIADGVLRVAFGTSVRPLAGWVGSSPQVFAASLSESFY